MTPHPCDSFVEEEDLLKAVESMDIQRSIGS